MSDIIRVYSPKIIFVCVIYPRVSYPFWETTYSGHKQWVFHHADWRSSNNTSVGTPTHSGIEQLPRIHGYKFARLLLYIHHGDQTPIGHTAETSAIQRHLLGRTGHGSILLDIRLCEKISGLLEIIDLVIVYFINGNVRQGPRLFSYLMQLTVRVGF